MRRSFITARCVVICQLEDVPWECTGQYPGKHFDWFEYYQLDVVLCICGCISAKVFVSPPASCSALITTSSWFELKAFWTHFASNYPPPFSSCILTEPYMWGGVWPAPDVRACSTLIIWQRIPAGIACFRWMLGTWTHHVDRLVIVALELVSWCSV